MFAQHYHIVDSDEDSDLREWRYIGIPIQIS